jgi:signal peptidase I
MIPTLQIGDRVLANKFIYRFTGSPSAEISSSSRASRGGGEDLIKRVVGVPGDESTLRRGRMMLTPKPAQAPMHSA